MKVLEARFVTSAADASAIPRDGLPHVALVGRSNVGKSTLINALAGRTIARTSAAPGKTRLANLYRVHVSGGRPDASGAPAAWRLYLVDLPGYGYATGGKRAIEQLAAVVAAYVGQWESADPSASSDARGTTPSMRARRHGPRSRPRSDAGRGHAALLIVDARHRALEADRSAREWLRSLAVPYAIVATKIDKLSRNARARALRAIEQQHDRPVLPVSAVTGEGMDELWMQIVKLASP